MAAERQPLYERLDAEYQGVCELLEQRSLDELFERGNEVLQHLIFNNQRIELIEMMGSACDDPEDASYYYDGAQNLAEPQEVIVDETGEDEDAASPQGDESADTGSTTRSGAHGQPSRPDLETQSTGKSA